MIIAGAILLALGIGSTIYGFHLNNSMEAQLNALFSSGNVDPGTVWIVAGIIALVVGIVLLAFGITKNLSSGSRKEVFYSASVMRKKACPHCGKKLDESLAFCPFCGQSTAEKKSPREDVCPYCESILPAGVAFCPACGKRVGAEFVPVRPTSVPTSVPTPVPTPNPPKVPDPPAAGGWSTPTDSDL